MREILSEFFRSPPPTCGKIANERSLQLELGIYVRQAGFCVDFELSFKAPRLDGSTLKPKHNLDLLVTSLSGERFGIELKVPLNGQHPETIYKFCADIEFVESLKREGLIDSGFAIMLTPDRAFWTDSGRGSPIHNMFRQAQGRLSGLIGKPTGIRDTCVRLEREYAVANNWLDARNLLPRARCLVVPI